MAYISDDVLFWDILVKLPVKSLVRFKSVSTKWGFLLSDSKFAKTHLQISKKNHSSCQDFIMYEQGLFDTIALLRVTDNQFNCSKPILEATKLDYPLRDLRYINNITHCDGILCMYTLDGSFVVWNPLTKVQKVFKKGYKCRRRWEAFGFGYDPTIDDYKIVYATGNESSRGCLRIQVLRLKTGFWTDIDPTKCFQLDFGRSWVCRVATNFNGCLYWLPASGSNAAIVSFDLGKETMRYEPSLSNGDDPNFFEFSTLGILRGSLCLSRLSRVGNNPSRFVTEIWLMKQSEGDGKFWSKLMTIQCAIPCIYELLVPIPLCFAPSDDHHQVLANIFDRGKLFLCNAKEGKAVEIYGDDDIYPQVQFDVIPFTGSLLSP